MSQKLTFGNPWTGQNDRKTIDADPGTCVLQNDIWLGRQDVLQRRPAMKAYTVTGSTPLSAAKSLIPINSRIDYLGTDYKTYNPVLMFQSTSGSNSRYSMLYHSTDETVVSIVNPMVIQGLQSNVLQPAGRCPRIAGIPGQQAIVVPSVTVASGQAFKSIPFVLFAESRNIPDYGTDKSQLLKVTMPDIDMPTLTKTTGGSLTANNYYYIRYRFEVVDSNGVMRMCTDWSEPIGTVMGPSGETAIAVTTPYYYGTFTQDGVTMSGIGRNATPTNANGLAFHWNIFNNHSWKYRIQVARTQGATTNTYSEGPYYLVESSNLSASGQISVTTILADTDLLNEYSQWEDMEDAHDVIELDGVYVWVKPLAWNHDGLWWGTAEYPYLAYTSNWISVEIDSYLVKLDASTIACLGNRKIYIISNLPDTPSVSEYPLPATISYGAVWNAMYGGSSSVTSVFGQGTDGRIYDLVNKIPVTDVIPWLADDSTKKYQSQATFLGDITVVQKWNETDSTVISYAIRYSDNSIWKLPDGTVASSHYDNNYENLHRVLNQVKSVAGQLYLFYSDGKPADAISDTLADATTTPISSYWQSSWQSTGTSQVKDIVGIECRQEIGSQCTILIEKTDHPASGTEGSNTFTFTDPREIKSVNLKGKYFRIKISSIDGQLWNVNDVSVHYNVITTKNGVM